MRYRRHRPYRPEQQNESRADQIEHALSVATDSSGENENEPTGVFTDVSDLLASVRHFCDRAGIDYGEVDDHAYRAYVGDREDGANAERDTERFPDSEVTA